MSEQPLVLFEKLGAVARITLNRPEKLNALSGELLGELSACLEQARNDDEVRAVILTGAGRAFSAGADLGGPRRPDGRTLDEWWSRLQESQDRQMSIRDFPKPIIAAVNGHCLGRGLELALWCDIVLASVDATFGEPAIRHGSAVASMAAWLANPQQAKLLLLTGDTISAREAYEIGLVARVVPADRLQPEAERLARRIARVPPFAVRYARQMVNAMHDARGFRLAMDQGHKLEVLSHFRIPEAENAEGVNLDRLRRESGLKAYLEARDRPFEDDKDLGSS
jgi:enoyl-CoA hydratase/carnithine racemase